VGDVGEAVLRSVTKVARGGVTWTMQVQVGCEVCVAGSRRRTC